MKAMTNRLTCTLTEIIQVIYVLRPVTPSLNDLSAIYSKGIWLFYNFATYTTFWMGIDFLDKKVSC